jgi:predicted Zn-dependent peptidase
MLDRTTAPVAEPLTNFKFPKTNKISLRNGIECLVIASDKNPVVFIDLVLESGRWYETFPGISYLSAKMLTEGTRDKNAEDIAFAFEQMGSFIDINAGLDHVSIKLYCLKRHISKTLRLFKEIILEATFPEHEFVILQNIRAQQIANQHSQNTHYATIAFNEKLFGKAHPYGRIITPDTVMERQLNEVTDYFKSGIFNSPKVILAGDIDADCISEVEQVIGGLSFTKTQAEANKIVATSGHERIERNGSMQASIRIGGHMISKTHPDIHMLTLANTLFGGFFGSRLMKKIREEKGLTYGIGSAMIHTLHTSYWIINGELQKEKVEEGITAIEAELKRLAENPPSEKELATMQNYLRGKLLSSMDTVFNIASVYQSLFVHELTTDFLDDYLDALNGITPLDISEMVHKHLLQPDRLTLVLH